MNESIIVGLVVGVGVAAAGAIVGHFLRLREMREQWSEDERRRQSERRQDLLERDLTPITDFADADIDLWTNTLWWAPTGKLLSAKARAELGNEAFLMQAKADVAALSLGDESLNTGVKRLTDLRNQCASLLDPKTSQPYQGKEGEYHQALVEMRKTAAGIYRRRRELLH